jgi:hypothetical protein
MLRPTFTPLTFQSLCINKILFTYEIRVNYPELNALVLQFFNRNSGFVAIFHMYRVLFALFQERMRISHKGQLWSQICLFILIFATAFRLVLGPPKPPVNQCRSSVPGAERSGCMKLSIHFLQGRDLKCVELTSAPHIHLNGVVIRHYANFTATILFITFWVTSRR